MNEAHSCIAAHSLPPRLEICKTAHEPSLSGEDTIACLGDWCVHASHCCVSLCVITFGLILLFILLHFIFLGLIQALLSRCCISQALSPALSFRTRCLRDPQLDWHAHITAHPTIWPPHTAKVSHSRTGDTLLCLLICMAC